MQRRCRLASPVHVVPELSGIDAAAIFHPFPSFKLALDATPFTEMRHRATSVMVGKVLNLHQGQLAKAGAVGSFVGFMKTIELTLQLADELRSSGHGLNSTAAVHMTAQLIEHTFTNLLPLPKPWMAGGYPGDVFNPDDVFNLRHSEAADNITQVQQRHVLGQLLLLMQHYLAAVSSTAINTNNAWAREGSIFGKEVQRNEMGEFYVTLGAVLACFDATLRRIARDERGAPRPLVLSQLFNGAHASSKSEFLDGSLRFDLHSFIGLPFERLLNETPVRRHGAQRARQQVMAYFSLSQFATKLPNPKKPSALGELFNVLLEPQKIVGKDGGEGTSVKQRVAVFSVDADSQGQAAGDAIENLTKMLLQTVEEQNDVVPPNYLPYQMRNTIYGPRPPYSTYLHLGSEWEKHGYPEFNHIRDVLVLFKFGLDWMPTIRTLAAGKGRYQTVKRQWGSGAILPRHVLPGYWAEKTEGDSEQKTIFMFWLGRHAYSNNTSVEAMPLRAVEDQGGVEELRRSLGLQCQLHQHMTNQETRDAEDKDAERNAQKILKMMDVVVDEDRVLLHQNLPLTVDAKGILSQEEAEQLLTLLAAPYMSLALVFDFFTERSGHLLNADLANLFQQLLFEPQAFQGEPGLELPPGVSVEVGEGEQDKLEPLVPVEREQRKQLGTPNGILYHELRMRPKAILGGLCNLCVQGVAKCVSNSSSSYVSLLMLLVRIAMAVEASMLSVLTHLDEDGATCFDEVMDEALPELTRLRAEFAAPATSLLEHWIVQDASDRTTQLRLVLLHSHLVLIHGNLFRGWSHKVVDTPRTIGSEQYQRLASDTVLRMAPSLAFVVLYGEAASLEDVKESSDEWLLHLIRGSLMSHVYTTIQESRKLMMEATSVDELAKGDVHIWFDRTISVAQRQHSGGEPFPHRDGEKSSDLEDWESVGQQLIMCERVVNSPGWQEGSAYPPSCDMYFELQVARALTGYLPPLNRSYRS